MSLPCVPDLIRTLDELIATVARPTSIAPNLRTSLSLAPVAEALDGLLGRQLFPGRVIHPGSPPCHLSRAPITFEPDSEVPWAEPRPPNRPMVDIMQRRRLHDKFRGVERGLGAEIQASQ